MNPKISVIIPVYNSELYISECIESLINQSLKECEFIFVNDGSSDKSAHIIEKYSLTDSRINSSFTNLTFTEHDGHEQEDC